MCILWCHKTIVKTYWRKTGRYFWFDWMKQNVHLFSNDYRGSPWTEFFCKFDELNVSTSTNSYLISFENIDLDLISLSFLTQTFAGYRSSEQQETNGRRKFWKTRTNEVQLWSCPNARRQREPPGQPDSELRRENPATAPPRNCQQDQSGGPGHSSAPRALCVRSPLPVGARLCQSSLDNRATKKSRPPGAVRGRMNIARPASKKSACVRYSPKEPCGTNTQRTCRIHRPARTRKNQVLKIFRLSWTF